MNENRIPPTPLYRDPIYDGAADPVVTYNPKDNKWYMMYTQRRANVPCRGVAYAYGTAIGVAVSEDGGVNWYYLGMLDLNFEWGHHTFWAPEIIEQDGIFHMYVSHIKGIYHYWGGRSAIVHYTSEDLLNWTKQSVLDLKSSTVIDSCIHKMPDGKFRMWYRNCDYGDQYTWAADSQDLYHWEVVGPVNQGYAYHEGQNVFRLGGYYWLIADTGNGMYVWRSENLEDWQKQEEKIMLYPGSRIEDGVKGGHADVVVCEEDAYIFYFVHPERTGDFWNAYDEVTHRDIPYHLRRSSIQVALLEVKEGQLVCERDKKFEINLKTY